MNLAPTWIIIGRFANRPYRKRKRVGQALPLRKFKHSRAATQGCHYKGGNKITDPERFETVPCETVDRPVDTVKAAKRLAEQPLTY
jgi:hypothetical protein